MYRAAMEKLYKWKDGKRRKPLIIEGARQVGKTWLMKEFGRTAYADAVYINFDSNSVMADLFAADLNTDRLILGIEMYCGHKIDAENTLLIFDEVQEVPRALASLKYFCEDAPQYHIVCAGSLLGIALHEGTSFPVGKTDFLKLYPLSFREFLMAAVGERYAELLDSRDHEMITSFKQIYIDALKQYYFVGGMPEAVQCFADERDFNEVRLIQQRILAAYEDLKAFKLFSLDVGLLACQAGLHQRTLVEGNDLFIEFKGALTEQYVCQQLKTLDDIGLYYYTNERGSCEIDFIADTGAGIIPVEVKAETNLKAKSLRTYYEKFKPEISVRTSMADYKMEEWLLNLPLYAVEKLAEEVNIDQ